MLVSPPVLLLPLVSVGSCSSSSGPSVRGGQLVCSGSAGSTGFPGFTGPAGCDGSTRSSGFAGSIEGERGGGGSAEPN